MFRISCRLFGSAVVGLGISAILIGCGGPVNTTNSHINSSNSTFANTNFNTNISNVNANSSASAYEFAEPQSYQGVIRLTLQTMGEQQNASMPPLAAIVARNGDDRAMEFTLPTNEKISYIEKGNMKYLVLPARKQYAELTADALGFEVRRLMMPEQVVNQLKGLPGINRAGEENMNGRTVVKYTYGNTTNTGTQAGTVATESYFLIDKETNLPVRSEVVSQSASGGNVQGVKGVRLLTEMTDIKPTPDASLFNVPTDFAKIDPEQVKAQTQILFNAAAAVIGQMINQNKVSPTPATNSSPMGNQ